MVRFIHTADWQIGMTRHFLSQEAQARFTVARIDSIRTINALAIERKCDFILVCGDVFESNHLNRQVVVRALDAMASSALPIYLLPGNHDSLEPGSVYRSPTFTSKKPDNVHVVESAVPVEVMPGIQIVGAPWTSKRPLTDLVAQALGELEPAVDQLCIVAGHGIVDKLSPDPDNPALLSLSQLEQHLETGAVHYVALGDRHSLTPVGSSDRIYYSGAPEPTDYDESNPGQVLVVEIQPKSVTVDPVRVATWRFLDHRLDINTDADIDGLESWLGEQPDKERTIVRLGFVGTVSISQKARLDSVLEHFTDLYGAIEVWERNTELAVMPDDKDFSDFGMTGFAANAMQELREVSIGEGEESDVAKDALALLYRLSGGTA